MSKRHFLVWVGLMGILTAFMTGGCIPLDEYGSSGGGGGSYGKTTDDTEDLLVVSGDGENILLEYNTLTFPAYLNWQDGNYYFAPDIDGSVTGNKIICVAEIESSQIQGDCFREGRVCHFQFYDSYSSHEDSYYLGSTSCKTAASMGPFLVPLEAPLCGQNPFPACPDNDLSPEDLSEESFSDPTPESPESEDQASAIDTLLDELCDATVRCDGTLSSADCVTAMNGEAGRQIWDDFGLVDLENQLTTEDVKQGLTDGTIVLDESGLDACLTELADTCIDENDLIPVGSYDNVENIILEDGDCATILEEVL